MDVHNICSVAGGGSGYRTCSNEALVSIYKQYQMGIKAMTTMSQNVTVFLNIYLRELHKELARLCAAILKSKILYTNIIM